MGGGGWWHCGREKCVIFVIWDHRVVFVAHCSEGKIDSVSESAFTARDDFFHGPCSDIRQFFYPVFHIELV